MKKILLVHNNYRFIGGEDVAVLNEVNYLKKYFIVETLYFSNKNLDKLHFLISLFTNTNIQSNNLLKKKIRNFNPDIVYIHNLWFSASLGILKYLKKNNFLVFLKLHNFRYFCSKHILKRNHLKKIKLCPACGYESTRTYLFNKYFEDSYLKSIYSIYFSKKLFKYIKKLNLKIIVLTNYHKEYLNKLKIDESKLFVFPNFIDTGRLVSNKNSDLYITYAGRISREKGVEELIIAFNESKLQNYKLKILGEGPILEELKLKYSSSKVKFYGVVDNYRVLEIISKSRAVVTATKLLEGQPTLLCEASKMGIPSIFPKTGGIEEFFPENYSLSFKQYDYLDLIMKLNELENLEKAKIIGSKNMEFINNKLDPNKMIKTFKEIING